MSKAVILYYAGGACLSAGLTIGDGPQAGLVALGMLLLAHSVVAAALKIGVATPEGRR